MHQMIEFFKIWTYVEKSYLTQDLEHSIYNIYMKVDRQNERIP